VRSLGAYTPEVSTTGVSDIGGKEEMLFSVDFRGLKSDVGWDDLGTQRITR
jgi:hypothetical protein